MNGSEQTEQPRTEDEEIQQFLVAHAPDAILLFADDGRLLAANATAASILGWTPQELLGKTVDDIDADCSTPRFQAFVKQIPPDVHQLYETNYRRQDGSLITVEVSGSKRNFGGKTVFHVSARDISARKQVEQELRESEEKYRALINGMLDTIWVVNFDGRFIDANRAATDVLGYTREEILTMGPTDLDSNLAPEAIKELIRTIPAAQIQVFETVHTAKDGRQIPVEIQSSLVMYQGEKAILSIARDITDRKQAEKELLKLKKLESIGLLAGGIAHDFNNLLTALFGNIELGKMVLPDDHKAYKFLEAAGLSLERATNLTKQLLTFAKGGAPIKETLTIGETLVETARFSLHGSNAKLDSTIAPDLWPIEADRGQLSQVISNLVLNALEAMPDGGMILLDATNLSTHDGDFVQITVQDEGTGIDPLHIDNIFDPYFTTKQKGGGLGLSISHSIVTKHGGTITVGSTLTQGTTFTIRLPAVARSATAPSTSGAVADDHAPLAPVRILILDDEEAIRSMLGEMLARMGHKIVYAVDGQEAIDQYREAYSQGRRFDVVISDLTLPGGMSGQAAAEQILAFDPQAKLIMSSGYSTDARMANYRAHGFQGAVAKPYRYADLEKVLRRVLKP